MVSKNLTSLKDFQYKCLKNRRHFIGPFQRENNLYVIDTSKLQEKFTHKCFLNLQMTKFIWM